MNVQEEEMYKNIIYTRMKEELASILTTGRRDFDLIPYTDDELNTYFLEYKADLDLDVDIMYQESKENNELDILSTEPNDAFREYLSEKPFSRALL